MRRGFQVMATVLTLTLALAAGALMYGQQAPYYGNPPYAGYSGSGSYSNDASHIGYMDGVQDGQRDLYTGHGFRPTHDANFRHADRGYGRHLGPKWDYQQAYRDGYMKGYERSYSRGVQRGYRY
jgi:hypothetical protein